MARIVSKEEMHAYAKGLLFFFSLLLHIITVLHGLD